MNQMNQKNSRSHLLGLIANRVADANGKLLLNRKRPLVAEIQNRICLFDIRSMRATKLCMELRFGMSQLYEYCYKNDLRNANLVLVIERPLPQEHKWMQEYLEKDRNISVVWYGDGGLHASTKTRKGLKFLFND